MTTKSFFSSDISDPCPLCGANTLQQLEKINVSDLLELYKKRLHCSIAKEYKECAEITYVECTNCHLHFFSPSLAGSPTFYGQLSKGSTYYLQEKAEYATALSFIGSQDKVLEIGPGAGAFAKKLKTQRYVGLEVSPEAIQLANAAGVSVINESLEEHSRKNEEQYDVVCAFQVLEHISNIATFINACKKCLKIGGVLIYSVPSADSFLQLLSNATLNFPPHHLSRWPDFTLKKVAHIFDLKLVSLEHEFLADIHVPTYATTVCAQAIKNILHRDNRSIDLTLGGKVITILAGTLGKFYSRGLKQNCVRPYGHSVTVAYSKQGFTQ